MSSPHAAPPNCEAMGSGGSLRLSVTADNVYFIIQPSSQPITGTLSEREVLSLRNFCDVWQKKAKEAGTRSIRPILCETFSWRNVCCKGLLLDELSDKKCTMYPAPRINRALIEICVPSCETPWIDRGSVLSGRPQWTRRGVDHRDGEPITPPRDEAHSVTDRVKDVKLSIVNLSLPGAPILVHPIPIPILVSSHETRHNTDIGIVP